MTTAGDDRLSVMRKTFGLFRRIVAYGRATPAGRQVVYDRLSQAIDTLAQTCPSGPTRTAIEGALARLQPDMTVELLDTVLETIENAWCGPQRRSSVALEELE